jgi:hypothetical protein
MNLLQNFLEWLSKDDKPYLDAELTDDISFANALSNAKLMASRIADRTFPPILTEAIIEPMSDKSKEETRRNKKQLDDFWNVAQAFAIKQITEVKGVSLYQLEQWWLNVLSAPRQHHCFPPGIRPKEKQGRKSPNTNEQRSHEIVDYCAKVERILVDALKNRSRASKDTPLTPVLTTSLLARAVSDESPCDPNDFIRLADIAEVATILTSLSAYKYSATVLNSSTRLADWVKRLTGPTMRVFNPLNDVFSSTNAFISNRQMEIQGHYPALVSLSRSKKEVEAIFKGDAVEGIQYGINGASKHGTEGPETKHGKSPKTGVKIEHLRAAVFVLAIQASIDYDENKATVLHLEPTIDKMIFDKINSSDFRDRQVVAHELDDSSKALMLQPSLWPLFETAEIVAKVEMARATRQEAIAKARITSRTMLMFPTIAEESEVSTSTTSVEIRGFYVLDDDWGTRRISIQINPVAYIQHGKPEVIEVLILLQRDGKVRTCGTIFDEESQDNSIAGLFEEPPKTGKFRLAFDDSSMADLDDEVFMALTRLAFFETRFMESKLQLLVVIPYPDLGSYL